MFDHFKLINLGYHLSDLKLFLSANGQGFSYFTEGNIDDQLHEDFESSLLSQEEGESMATQQNIKWGELKNRVLDAPSGKYHNPWKNRIEFGGRDATVWQENFRRDSEFFKTQIVFELQLCFCVTIS